MKCEDLANVSQVICKGEENLPLASFKVCRKVATGILRSVISSCSMAASTCSGVMVVFFSFSLMPLADEETISTNSVIGVSCQV